MKLNRKFAKPQLKADGTPDYAPAALRIPVVNSFEYEECVNPEEVESGAEPVYETKIREQTTYKTKLNPSGDDYALMGYIPVSEDPPRDPAPEGFHYVKDGYEIVDGKRVAAKYSLERDPLPPPRVFDPYLLMDKLMSENVWDTVKEWIQSDPEGWDRWSKAPDIDENEPLLAEIVSTAKTAFGWDDAKVEEILSASVKTRL